MKRNILVAIFILVFIYISSYAIFRQTNIEIWEKDGQAYVIFPADKVYLYYLFRPVSYIDGIITGMRFHIGAHQ
jgi:hypothetical protein